MTKEGAGSMKEENIFIKAVKIIWSSFLLGICTLVVNAVLIFLLLTVKVTLLSLPLYLIGLLLIGPSLGAVFETELSFLLGRDTKLVKSYFHRYRTGFKSSSVIWIPYLFVLLITFADLYYISISGKMVMTIPLLFIIVILTLISYVYTLTLYAKFVMKTKDILKLSLYLTINRPVRSVFIIFCLLILYMFFKIAGNLAVFWGIPLFAMFVVGVLKKMLNQIETDLAQY